MKNNVMAITPKMAAGWLRGVDETKQRKVNLRTVSQYAAAMRLGHWMLTHQGIAFDETEALCDGQHRLMAIVESGVTVQMYVATGVPVKQGDLFVFDAIDRGSLRKICEQLHIRHGVKDAARIAAGARIIATMCCRSSVKMTVATSLEILDRFGESLNFVSHAVPVEILGSSASLGALAFCHRAMPSELREFVLRVGDGAGISKGNPALTLRNYLLCNRRRGGLLCNIQRACALCAMHAVLGSGVNIVRTTMAGVDFFADKQSRAVEEVRSMF